MEKEIVIKNKKPISEKHWRVRVQKYVFNIDCMEFYSGYCPLYWMSWIAAILFPFAAIVKLIVKGWDSLIVEPKQKWENVQYKELENVPLIPSDSFLIEAHTRGISLLDCINKYAISSLQERRMILWAEQNPNWGVQLQEAIERKRIREEFIAKYQAKQKRKKDRLRNFSNAVSKYASFVLKPILIILAGVVIFAVGLGIYNLIISGDWWPVLLSLGGFVGVLVGIFASFILIEWVRCKIKSLSTKDGVSLPNKLFNNIKLGFGCIKDLIYMVYKSNCPMLEWGDEDGPIEKNKFEDAKV